MTCRYSRSAPSASPDAAAMRASWTRAWAATHAAWAASAASNRLPLELLGFVQVAARERVRPESGEGERGVVAERRRRPRARARAGMPPPRRCRPAVAPRPTPRAAAPGRGTRRSRSRPSDGGSPHAISATVATSPARAAAAARMMQLAAAPQSSPAASSGRARFSRQCVGALLVPGLRQGVREGQLREPEFPGRRRARGERERAFAGRERGVEIELLGREVAEDCEQLDPQLDRRGVAAVADSASSRKRRPSETRSASAKYSPSVPSRLATAGSGASRAYSSAPRDCRSPAPGGFPSQPLRSAQLDARLVGQGREVLGVGARGRRRDRRSRRDARARTSRTVSSMS